MKALQEGLGGIRDVLLDGTQPVYCDAYRQADQPLRRAQGNNIFIAQSPRYAMEALGMVLIAALAYGSEPSGRGHCDGAARPRRAGSWAPNACSRRCSRPTPRGPASREAKAYWPTSIELLDQPIPEELLQPAPAPLQFKTCDSIRSSALSLLRAMAHGY